MSIQNIITGVQHIGLPTSNMQATLSFYKSLGFEVAFNTNNNDYEVCFLRLNNIVIEAYESAQAMLRPGAIDHIALDVVNVDDAYEIAKTCGYTLLHSEIQFLPFWDNGVRFFTISGPNAEKIEFSQML